MSNVLKTVNLTKTFTDGSREVEILKGINLEIKVGELCGIMGQSGSGKSTLLHILGLLEPVSKGHIEILGENPVNMTERQQATIRRNHLGFIFQAFYLIPGLTVYENIIMPSLLDKRKIDKDYIQYLIKIIGLNHRKDHTPKQLSGGEQQRVAIARALANKPEILLADEPTGNLDEKNSQQIIGLLQQINQERNVTMVMVTHSNELAKACNRVVNIKDGKVI